MIDLSGFMNIMIWNSPLIAPQSLGSVSALGIFFLPFPTRACFCPVSPNNLEYLLAVPKNPAHPLHPVYDDGKGGVWKWWWHFVLLNSHVSAYATCFARNVCRLVRSTWGTSRGEDTLGARDRIFDTKDTKIQRYRACARQMFPLYWMLKIMAYRGLMGIVLVVYNTEVRAVLLQSA